MLNTRTNSAIRTAITELEAERRKVDDAIEQLRHMLGDTRPAARRATTTGSSSTPARARPGKKPVWTPAMRKAAADRMKKRWAQRKKR